jgi:hypothetical protein
MKKLMLLSILFCATAAPLMFAAYPNEFPIYLGVLGFKKSEITDLQNGGIVSHMLQNRLPGEYGIIAALVQNVPPYYFRDYYKYIESFRTLNNFEQVGEFKNPPALQDLEGLQFSEQDLSELLACRASKCDLKLSEMEIGSISKNGELHTDSGKQRVADAYRQILLNRLLAYQKGGTAALGAYIDGAEPQNPDEILKLHLYKFPYLQGYFPSVEKTILEYPGYQEKGMQDFFFWSKEYLGNKPVISIRHVMMVGIGEDYLIVNKLVYSDHYFLSSLGIIHLINYANKTIPRTLLVYNQRTLTDLTGDPLKALGRNVLRSNLEKKVTSGFDATTKAIEARYVSRWYSNFPFGLLPRDQR